MNRLNGKYTFHGQFVYDRPMYVQTNGNVMWFNGQSGDEEKRDWIISKSSKVDQTSITGGLPLVRSRTNTMCPKFGIAAVELLKFEWSVIPNPSVPVIG